ncbi:hypothetical protein EIQ06_02905 [Xanthomonas campestris pv. campestris]|nr:hypothetical protein [Xanthomonas campestris]MEA0625237.1 hypothetical protein [Xanthomonas campestris pv. campestris]MEA0666151.1 hypothetical protein [Xanthomonas campestris pv. campestris]MEA0674693.1 hypothetical protein [Xanthomonas campestris pv. campestris]MEA0703621.1 hypothetical protein [Xanthomonas campestris pv. campestris]MEA0723189.1 hypothetical protein [Xanthomonas campestris pv. campestris]
MDKQQHAIHLGGLVGNLQSLEIAIRLALAQLPGSPAKDTYGDDFRNAKVGTLVPVSDLSSFASLRELIKVFNEKLSPNPPLDLALVTLRDAIAHGRVFAGPDEEEFRVVKFEKPQRGATQVAVEYSAVMTEAWFMENKAWVRDAIETVDRAWGKL